MKTTNPTTVEANPGPQRQLLRPRTIMAGTLKSAYTQNTAMNNTRTNPILQIRNNYQNNGQSIAIHDAESGRFGVVVPRAAAIEGDRY